MRIPRLANGCLLLFCLLLAVPAVGQTQGPTTAPVLGKVDQAMEDQPLRLSSSDIKPGDAHATATGTTASSAGDLSRVVISLLVVIGLILLLRLAVRHMTAVPGTVLSGKMVSVLSRSAISPRQQILVLQVGNRLLVVGDSGGRMNSLCEITDPDEIAMLVGQTRQAREAAADRNPASFLNFFRRANEPFAEIDAMQPAETDQAKPIDPDEAVSTAEMSGLMDKVRMLQEQFRAKA